MLHPRVVATVKKETAPKIYLSVPHNGMIRPELAQLSAFWLSPEQKGYRVILGDWPQLRPVDYARNVMVKTFLATDCTHLLMIDADIIPPPNILALADFGQEIIGGLCPILINGRPLHTVMYRAGEGHGYRMPDYLPAGKLLEVDATGTGCLLVHRRVFERMAAENLQWFDYELEHNGTGVYSSEDYSFCRKAKTLGFKVHVHSGYICGHVKEVDLRLLHGLIYDDRLMRERQRERLGRGGDFGCFGLWPLPENSKENIFVSRC